MASTAQGPEEIAAAKSEVLAELEALEDPKILAVNQKHGDTHAVNLTQLRAVAKRLKAQPELARALWEAESSAAKLLAILISRPRDYSQDELDAMLRSAGTPKVHDWLVNYLALKSPHSGALREIWLADPDPVVASAGWAVTSDRVVKQPEGIDQDALLDQIEAEMRHAPERLQWAMNTCLAQIGITNPQLRARARDIGVRLEVLKDYPTSPGCTSPFAPTWIDEMVRRAESG